MMRSSSVAIPPRLAGTIDLQISDPVTMLNEVARRYETTEPERALLRQKI